MKPKSITQTYNDGSASVYRVDNIADKGDKPKEGLVLRVRPLYYEERTVGMSRFWTASQEDTKIERLLRFPRLDFVYRNDIIVPNDGKQYKIVQIQYPPDVEPKSMDLSLERIEVAYEVK